MNDLTQPRPTRPSGTKTPRRHPNNRQHGSLASVGAAVGVSPRADERGGGHEAAGLTRFRTVLLVLLVAIGLVGVRGYWLWKSPPTYWQTQQQYLKETTSQQRMAIAQSVEQRILDRLGAVSTDATPVRDASDADGQVAVIQAVDASRRTVGAEANAARSIFLTLNEINAWVDQRLGDWASNQGSSIPDDVTHPMVAIEGDHLVFAFQFEKPNFKQVISAVANVQIAKDDHGEPGQATIRIVKIRGGRLEIPGIKAVTGVIEEGADQESGLAELASKITEVFDGKAFDPLIKINHKKIRVVSFQLRHKPAGLQLLLAPDTL